jgi:hypothetical protein
LDVGLLLVVVGYLMVGCWLVVKWTMVHGGRSRLIAGPWWSLFVGCWLVVGSVLVDGRWWLVVGSLI